MNKSLVWERWTPSIAQSVSGIEANSTSWCTGIGLAWTCMWLSDWFFIGHRDFCPSSYSCPYLAPDSRDLHCAKSLLAPLQLFLLNILSSSFFYSNISIKALPSVFYLPEIHSNLLTADVSPAAILRSSADLLTFIFLHWTCHGFLRYRRF